MDDNNSERQDLYDEFVEEIVKGNSPDAFFDESELVDIFDYASDLDNFIVKIEVLLYGAVHFPKSEALATRRAWLYYSLGDIEAGEGVSKRSGSGSVLDRILEHRAADPMMDAGAEIHSMALEDILSSVEDFDDEEIIQFVDYGMDAGASDWLASNKDRIQARCSYPQTFLYEMGNRYEDDERPGDAAAMFEELTMLEPFNLDFWQRLAQAQLADGKYQVAISTADYALAIDSSYIQALRIKGMALFRLEEDMGAVVEIFERVVADESASDEDVSTLAAAYADLGQRDRAIRFLLERFRSQAVMPLSLNLLMALDPPTAAPFVKAYIKAAIPDEQTAINWARTHLQHAQYASAATMLLAYHDMRGFKTEYPFLLEVAYFGGEYERVVQIYASIIADNEAWSLIPSVAYPYIMSLLRLGHTDQALSEIATMLENLNAYRAHNSIADLAGVLRLTPAMAQAAMEGYTTTLSGIATTLLNNPSAPLDSIDPMK